MNDHSVSGAVFERARPGVPSLALGLVLGLTLACGESGGGGGTGDSGPVGGAASGASDGGGGLPATGGPGGAGGGQTTGGSVGGAEPGGAGGQITGGSVGGGEPVGGDAADAGPEPDALPPDETPPEVFFRSPFNGMTVGGVVDVTAEATDDRGVTGVTFALDGADQATTAAEPYTWSWDTAGLVPGPYALSATATDAAGNVETAVIEVQVSGACQEDGNCPPVDVRIITPVDGGTVCGELSIEAAASDDDLLRIEVSVDGRPVGVAERAPYAVVWDTAALENGPHVISAVAVDAADQRAFTRAVVDVQNVPGVPCDNVPNVRISSPEDGAYLNGDVPLVAQASDNGVVVSVEFSIDNGRLAVVESIPWEAVWNSDDLDEGVHTVKATATDNSDKTASAQVQVTVDRTEPSVEILAPGFAETFANSVPFLLNATDNFGVERVEVMLNGQIVATLIQAPFEGELDTAGFNSGDAELAAIAYDRVGLSDVARTQITLDRPPTLNFSEPEDGDTLDGPTEVRVSAQDDLGVGSVELFIDGEAYDTDFGDESASFGWEPEYERGMHTLRAVVTDSGGQTAEASIDVLVDHPFEVSLTRPFDGQSVADTVTLSAETRDDDGRTERVEFFVDGNLVGTVAAAPFEVDVDTTALGDGNRQVRVHAVSDNGSEAEDTVTMRVNNCDRDEDGYLGDSEACGGPDCDDERGSFNPGASDDVGDGNDQNCDDLDGEDGDGDGFASENSGGDDCDDDEPLRRPGLEDTVGDGRDNNCDDVDGVDADGDGYASELSLGSDCDDADVSRNPGAADGAAGARCYFHADCQRFESCPNPGEFCDSSTGECCRDDPPAGVPDGIDQNCDGIDGVDADSDGHASRGSGGDDCEDRDDAIHPCADDPAGDQVDADCDGRLEQGCNDCNGCTADTPNGAACTHTPIGEGQACDDGDACTRGELCRAGACGNGVGVQCNDGDICTADFCAPLSGCDTAPAVDGIACPGGGTCQAGACCVPQCDGRACGDDTCGGSCGDCPAGFSCDPEGQCVDRPPVPPGYVRIEPGVFQMGSPAGEAGRDNDETQHQVTLTRPYALKATEVTQGEWFALLGSRPSYFANCGNDCPVEDVSWYESIAYVNALSQAQGLPQCYQVVGAQGTLGGGCDPGDEFFCFGDFRYQTVMFAGLDCAGYRLPTEAEWEYAARAGTAGASYNGAIGNVDCGFDANLDAIGWYCGNSGDQTHVVGGKRPNAWGLYDMLGNVWEWNLDWYGAYPGGALLDPLGPAAGAYRVIRGGSWNNDARGVRAARRGRNTPENRYSDVGLRPARSL